MDVFKVPFLKRFAAVLVFFLFVAGTLTFHSFYEFLNPAAPTEPRTVVVQIQPGMSLHRISRLLEREGLIQDSGKFMLLAWWIGMGKKIQWGDFEIPTGLPPATLLDYLTSGRTLLKRITIPEGFTLRQIADRLAHEQIADTATFLAQARDPLWAAELGVEGASLEGYLFPDTYFLHRGLNAAAIQKRMVRRFQAMYQRCREEGSGGLPPGFTDNQVVILASIVEKESGYQAERALIASVFYNRLRAGMPLQSDPTVIYGLRQFDGDLTRRHLETDSPYNTYTRSGLPPSPIANPGAAALRAVLNPARSDYFYFVSRNDGSHVFSRTLEEHNRAVARYQLPGGSGRSSPGKKIIRP